MVLKQIFDLPWVRKSCPSFNVKEWLKEIDFHL